MKNFDVIVIGSGLAGLNFALRQAERGKKVLIITKSKLSDCATNAAQGGIASVLSKLDNFQKHIKDTLVAGVFHNDKKAVKYMVKHGPKAIHRLIKLGVNFEKYGKELLLAREGGHSERRIAFSADSTGNAIEKALIKKTRSNKNITTMENTFAYDLLIKNGACHGVQIIRNHKFENIYGGIAAIATGGSGQLYSQTTNPEVATGDGLAMAFRAGACFRDLEFVQFHPTVLNLKGKLRFMISEAARGEGAYLRNSKGARFMVEKHPLAELAPRDIVSRAIYTEAHLRPDKRGYDGQESQVFLDLRHKDAKTIKARFPKIYKTIKKYGIDITKDLVPVSPAAHYMCGGIKVDLKGFTGIKNLYAFGEAAGTGVHGANRLASNSLLEALVFSEAKIDYKNGRPDASVGAPRFTPVTGLEKKQISKIKETLKQTMWEKVGIVRSKKGLTEAVAIIKKLKNKLFLIQKNNREIRECENMLISAELIVKAALIRKKSLGCHHRTN